ncbi:MAG: Jag N-terminal domain-containing protein [Anaerolineae bacterium]|jgi:predicted RNA-binding protein Jag|nr:Jag N-terminal domain-containing protein [Anaerolineae bacterium]
MSTERRSIEITADTVDEAIQQGLRDLGVQPWDVMVEVVEEPSVGLFGTPPRKARVRLQLLRTGPTSPPPTTLPRLAQPDAEARRMQQGTSPSRYGQPERRDNERRDYSQPPRRDSTAGGAGTSRPERTDRPQRPDRPERSDAGGQRRDNNRPAGERRTGERPSGERGGDNRAGRDNRGGQNRRDNRDPRDRNRPVSRLLDQAMGGGQRPPQNPFDDDLLYDDLEDEAASLFTGYTTVEEADYDPDVATARELLVELLRHLDVSASVQVSRVDAAQGGGPWILNVQGQGRTTSLIGRRGDTLNALQYLLRLMVSHKLQHRINLILDVDGYKAKRAERLRALANKMANQALSEGRTIVMEPMPPHERRLVHIALRAHPHVTTKSIGEGEGRKVTIVPNKDAPKPEASAPAADDTPQDDEA